MKRRTIAVVALAGMAMGASLAHGAGGSQGGGIVGSKHDMNVYISGHAGTGSVDKDGRVCAYCHTPHHAQGITNNATWKVNMGGTDVDYNVYSPLWSRTIDSSKQFASYQSVTFNPTLNGGKTYDNLIGPSRLCMTCHDGATALDSYYGQPNNGPKDSGDDQINYYGQNHFRIGADGGLSNDHPIGMIYNDYYKQSFNGTSYELKDPDASKFNSPNPKSISDVLFEDPNNPGKFVTCASCHDVHNGKEVGNTTPGSGRGYFLRDTQNNSAFCIVCHDKNS